MMFPAARFLIVWTGGSEVSTRFWPYLALFIASLSSLAAILTSGKDGLGSGAGVITEAVSSNKKQAAFLAVSFVYVKAMEYVGFLAASLVMMPAVMWFYGCRDKRKLVVVPVIFLAIIHLIFSKVFRISFPSWALGV